MIVLNDIKEFFKVENSDADSKKLEYDNLSLENKISSGKAIRGLRLDKDFKEVDGEDNIRLLHIEENLSEFKIGDGVVLLIENSNSSVCECTISEFRENGDIEISINPYNFNSNIDDLTDQDLVLLKQSLSMRNFYSNFCLNVDFYGEGYFENHIINSIPKPVFEGDLHTLLIQNESAYQNIFGVTLNQAQLEAATKSELTKNYFLIQGPPGTGKSFLLASLILNDIFLKKKVVVVAPTHMAVNNLLVKVAELFMDLFENKSDAEFYIKNTVFKCGQSCNAKNMTCDINGEMVKIQNIPYLNVSYFNSWKFENHDGNEIEAPMGYVIGMTPYSLQSRRANGLEFDELIIDEAGQMTIPIAMMALVKYNKIILAGDHKQLPPIVSENLNNEELKYSIFEHLIRDYNSRMLDVSFRMNDIICDVVSTLFYDGKLKPYNGNGRLQTSLSEPILASENPVVFVNCNEKGKQFSKCEAQKAIEIVAKYIESGIPPEDIAILAPFRAQCALTRKLFMPYFSKDIRDKLVIDTVDRMQGQERQIIIYAFTSGDIEYMKEMEDFLYNPNKLNVAFSRAKNKLILLGNINSLSCIGNELLTKILQKESIAKF